MAEYRAVVIEKPTLSEANRAILDRCGFTDDYIATMPLDTLDLVIERIVDVAVLKQFGGVSEDVLDSISYNLRLHKEVLLADAVANYANVPTEDVVETTILLVKNIETKVTADISLHTKKVENNFNNVAIYQASAAALGVYGVKLPEIQSSAASHSVQPEGKTRVDLSDTSMSTLRRAGAVAAVVGVIAVAGISPAHAQDAATSSISATVENVVPTQQNSPVAEQVPAMTQEMIESLSETPLPSAVTTQELEQPKTAEPEPTVPPIVLGPPMDPIVITNEVIRPVTDSSMLTKQEALPEDTSLEEAIQNAEEEVIEDTISASEVKETLIDELEFVQDKIVKAIKTGDITAFGEDTAFNRKDPADKSKVLQLTISKTQRAMLAKHMGDINRVLENDPDAITKLMTFYAEKFANTEYAELNDQIAKFIVETRFTDGTTDLTMSQKILLMAIYTTVHEELVAQADAQYEKMLQQYKEDHPAPKPKPIHIENDGPDYSNEEWNGDFKITERHLRIIDSWPLSKAGKKIMPEIITTIINEADEQGLNPAIEIVRVLYETGMLKDDLSSKHFNYMGIKAGSSWDDDFVQVATHEDYGNGLVVVRHKFRSYDTPTEGLHDFFKIRQKDTYADARRFHLSPELYMSGDLGMLSKEGEVIGLQGQPGVLGWSTGRSVPYTALSLIARFNVDKIVPKHYLQGYDWNQKTYEGNPLPETIRGKTYYNQHDARYAHNPYRRHDSPRNYNVSTSGCMPTSLAIIVSNLTGKEVTPMDMIRFSLKHGYRTRDAGTSDSMVEAVARAYGLKARNLAQNAQAFQNGLQNGGMILVSGRDSDKQTPGTSSGHIYVVDDETQIAKSIRFQVLDANSTPNSLNNYTFSELSRDPNTGADSMRRAWLLTK
jgi:hypothetical protein